jgi:uncharacterized protein YfkK (UPF0435 family)
MTPIEKNKLMSIPTQNVVQNGKLYNHEVKTVDHVIKNQITDECKLCLYPLNNDDPLYMYNCKHILHEACHLQLINNGHNDCFVCHGNIKSFTFYKNATELSNYEGVTYTDENYNKKLEDIKLKNRVINSELLQNNNAYTKLLEQLEPAFILLEKEQNGLQKQEQLFRITCDINKNTNYEITPEITSFLASNNIFLNITQNKTIVNNHDYPEIPTNKTTENQNTTTRNNIENPKDTTSKRSDSTSFLTMIKKKLNIHSKK